MICKHIRYGMLSLLSAVLLSLGFLLPHCGGFALVGFVPLLWMDRMASAEGKRHFWWWHYLTFVLWNAFTTFWVCNATVGGGIAAILANAFQMSLVWALFRLFKKRFNGPLPYIFLAAAWIAWERFYFSAEISWPWLTLGNAFAGSHSCIQWYEITGVMGGSLWVWASNLSVFALMAAIQDGRWNRWTSKARYASALAAVIVTVGPLAASWIRFASFREDTSKGTMDVCLLQPNLDPYEKFSSLTQKEQNSILTGLMEEGMAEAVDSGSLLLVAPEAVTNDIIINNPDNSESLRQIRKTLFQRPETDILFGASTNDIIFQEEAPSYTARKISDGLWYENHNSAIMATGSGSVGIYHKSCLVIGTEKMPWPRITSKIEEALGGGLMGHCVGQDKPGLLYSAGIPIGCAVCYESIYPEHVASYAGLGAKVLTVITNDAWWGDTPGYRQHLNYSRLRAIETRRDLARSANTGITAFINQRGDITGSTQWWERTSLSGKVNLSERVTPFVKYGDVTGKVCTFLFLLLGLALLVRLFTGVSRKP